PAAWVSPQHPAASSRAVGCPDKSAERAKRFRDTPAALPRGAEARAAPAGYRPADTCRLVVRTDTQLRHRVAENWEPPALWTSRREEANKSRWAERHQKRVAARENSRPASGHPGRAGGQDSQAIARER